MKKPFVKSPYFRWGLIDLALIFLSVAVWQLVADRFRSEEKALRTRVRQTLTEAFPHHAQEVQAQFGLFPFSEPASSSDKRATQCGTVVLIHGLDDPGSVWRDLAPALVRSGYRVWYLHYPNDQPVVDSAQFFADCLQQLPLQGSAGVAIVAHSMGGLVTREMLTSPRIEYALNVKAGRVPPVDQLFMVGTPNHGSEMARFRLFAEIRDQWVALTQGKGHWLRWIFDGAGEAKIDLLPNSEFINRLNARSHPADVDMLIIAGVASPWKIPEIERLSQSGARSNIQTDPGAANEWDDVLLSVTDGLGDGLVTVESTRLAGIAHLTVDGTHMTMIRNITTGSSRVPPSVPVILDRLPACGQGRSRQ